MLVLLFVALWGILRGDLFYVLPCGILFLWFFSPLSIAITSLGEEITNLNAFRTFVRFALVWFCLFPLHHGLWEGLRFVIVALAGLHRSNFSSFPQYFHFSSIVFFFFFFFFFFRRPRWLSWMRRPTGDQEVAGSTPAEVGNILSWRLIMKYFLRSFSPFR